MDSRINPLSKVDLLLLIPSLALMVIGVLFIYSSGVTSDGKIISSEYLRQLIWVGLGTVILLAVALIKYEYFRDFTLYIYLFFLLLVGLTLLTGRVVNGAKSWLGVGELGIQPSEFLKVATILFLARQIERWGDRIKTLPYFLLSGVIVIIPMAAVLAQPDFGTSLVFVPIFLFMLFFAGAQLRHICYVLAIIVLGITFVLLPAWDKFIYPGKIPFLDIFFDKTLILIVGGGLLLLTAVSFIAWLVFKRPYFYAMMYVFSIFLISFLVSIAARFVLKDYQMERLIVFLDPYYDAKGSGWNIIQSVTAVGSGGFSGKGFLQGTQSHLRFLPEQSTDFIFSILSEEFGFLGAVVVFSCFLAIIFRGMTIAYKAKDTFGTLIAAGVVGMLFFHVLINIGMAIGIMPITGIPLFFLSYGGSSLLTALIGIGLMMSVNSNKYQF